MLEAKSMKILQHKRHEHTTANKFCDNPIILPHTHADEGCWEHRRRSTSLTGFSRLLLSAATRNLQFPDFHTSNFSLEQFHFSPSYANLSRRRERGDLKDVVIHYSKDVMQKLFINEINSTKKNEKVATAKDYNFYENYLRSCALHASRLREICFPIIIRLRRNKRKPTPYKHNKNLFRAEW